MGIMKAYSVACISLEMPPLCGMPQFLNVLFGTVKLFDLSIQGLSVEPKKPGRLGLVPACFFERLEDLLGLVFFCIPVSQRPSNRKILKITGKMVSCDGVLTAEDKGMF